MCGRFSLGATTRVGQLFDLPNWPDTPSRYNMAPSQEVQAVIQNRETGARECRLFRWGLVPFWAKDPAIGNRMINGPSPIDTATVPLTANDPSRTPHTL